VKLSVKVAPALFEHTATTKTDDTITIIVNVTSDKEGTDSIAAVRIVFTTEEWKALCPK
jgi:acyl carrier protein